MRTNLALNLRRLVFFHHETARDAARVIGVAEQTLSAWITGKREPATKQLFRIAELYEVDPSKLNGDPLIFAEILGNPTRIKLAEENLRRAQLKAVE
jgi:transcriptional regulator with XRE-family HTH domain